MKSLRLGPMDLLAYMERFHTCAQARGLRREVYGKISSHELYVWSGGAENAIARVYISVGMHGDEPAPCFALCQFLEREALDFNCHWTLFPALNPSGLLLGTRENADGMDLNRDYLHLETAEVRYHSDWIAKNGPFDLYLSLHEDWESSGFYMYEINTSPHCPKVITESILQAVRSVMPLQAAGVIDEHQTDIAGLIQHRPEADEPEGWPEAIFHAKQFSELSYTFETPSKLPLEKRVDAHEIAIRTALAGYLRLC